MTTVTQSRSQENGPRAERIDVAVFGATPAGITAAVAAARAGLQVRLLAAGTRVGGMVSGGLSNTDTGPRGPEVISGLTGEFFARVRKIEQSRGVCIKSCESSYFFEPHVVEQVGTYALAAHVHRYLAAPVDWPGGVRKDAVVLEGTVISRVPDLEPYPISYRAITPRERDARNLLNPVTLSATSIAYSAIRMEPTFMMLGEAAGTAAALSVKSNVSVQALDYASLRKQLVGNGLRLER